MIEWGFSLSTFLKKTFSVFALWQLLPRQQKNRCDIPELILSVTHISPPEYSNPKSGPVNSGLQPLPLHNRDITQPRANSKFFLFPRHTEHVSKRL